MRRVPSRVNNSSAHALRVSDIRDTLPQEAQQWIGGLKREELNDVEGILNRVGVESFAQHWPTYKADLEAVRDF